MSSKTLAAETVECVLFPLVVHGPNGLATRATHVAGEAGGAHVVETFVSIRRRVEQAFVADDEAALLRFFDGSPNDHVRDLAEYLSRRLASDASLAADIDRLLHARHGRWPGVLEMLEAHPKAIVADSPFEQPMSVSVGGFMPAKEREVVDRLLGDSKS